MGAIRGRTVNDGEVEFYDEATGTVVLDLNAQSAVIADPAGGATIDAEARTAINAIIDVLQAYGMVATS